MLSEALPSRTMEQCARIESRCLAEGRYIVSELRAEFGVSRLAATYRVEELQLGWFRGQEVLGL